MKNFIEELRWRGMIHDVMPGTEEYLSKQLTAGYIGFDPTAVSLHIGNLATIMLLKHLQLAGHKPIALVGGATGMIGDPSGRTAEREFLSEETLKRNQLGIKKQLEKFLDFHSGANAAEIVNNYDWFRNINFLEFLREAGKHLTVNYMMAKESVKKRLEVGLTFTEFSYQLLQGFDFYYLYKHKNVRLQMGGSDQWGNITAGTELIRRKDGGEAFALTAPLITKSDGTKFGKSEGGNVWLDASLTSPYQFYQFWLNVSDEDASRLIRVYTLLDKVSIETLEAEHAQAPHTRVLQKALAKEVTSMVHSEEEYEKAVEASEILFGKGTTETLQSLDENTLLAVFEGVPQVEIKKEALQTDIASFLSSHTQSLIFSSKGEARRMVSGGGVSINKVKIENADEAMNVELLQDKYLIVQKGRRNYYLVRVV
ncbi:tyrosine--tRNA ligase [Rhodocytophaga aerolata]|uniref:Tyrosine--tRNA ligase n=1 Tax=Rhodocytophaga aerolata TaxID=455078 RepID=A0ABT8R7E1_9BACT|nr:tyrosine--tRNA ligase [Rhodocytophaga aerolata]MDO1448019.1 tyrosine--tRNA ligase [Rhodocytophaga aerolata]